MEEQRQDEFSCPLCGQDKYTQHTPLSVGLYRCTGCGFCFTDVARYVKPARERVQDETAGAWLSRFGTRRNLP